MIAIGHCLRPKKIVEVLDAIKPEFIHLTGNGVIRGTSLIRGFENGS